jgi:hypothetical protein
VVFFAAFSLLAFTGLFNLVELRFYRPQLVEALNHEVDQLSQNITTLLGDLEDRFAETLENGAVRRSFLPGQAAEDILERSRIYGLLLNSLPGLRTVRFVDAGGGRIHFSTLEGDALSRTADSLFYREYQDCAAALPYSQVAAEEGEPPRLIFDSAGEQLIYSYPFFDSLELYRGSALFTFSPWSITEPLIRRGQLKMGEDLALVESPGGFLLGVPAAGGENLRREAAAAWRENAPALLNLDQEGAEALTLVWARSGMGFFVGRLVQEKTLVLPPALRLILLSSFFLTAFLLIFLIFSLRQDSVAVIQGRLKQLQLSLIRQYYDNKSDMDWKIWSRELGRRREDVRLEIKRGLPRRGKKAKDIDALIDRSWDEVIRVIGGPSARQLDDDSPEPRTGRARTALEPETIEELEELEELRAEEDTEAAERSPGAAPLGPAAGEEAEVAEDIGKGDHASPEGILVTPDSFETGDRDETAAELEALEESPAPLRAAPMSPEELAALTSRIEFGPDEANGEDAEEGAASTGMELDLASPFDSLSFESPSFEPPGLEIEQDLPRPDSASGGAAKKHEARGGEGLEDIGEEGGLPLIYRPFQFRENEKPTLLRPLPEPGEGPIHEQDGIHHINSDILDPGLETAEKLDPKFLRLVESIISRDPSS